MTDHLEQAKEMYSRDMPRAVMANALISMAESFAQIAKMEMPVAVSVLTEEIVRVNEAELAGVLWRRSREYVSEDGGVNYLFVSRDLLRYYDIRKK